MEKQVIGDVIGGLVTLVLVFVTWFLKGNLLMIVSARVLGNIVWFLITFYYGKKYFNFKISFEKSIWKEIIHEALPIGMAILFWRLYYKADILLLRNIPIINSTTSNETIVGIYSIAYKIFDLIISIAGMFMVSAFPILAKYAYSDRTRFLKIYQKSFDFLMLLAFPMLVSVVILAPKLIMTFADSRFVEAIYILQILAFAAFFSFFNSLNNGAVVSLNKHFQLMLINIVGVVFNIGINLMVIPYYSNIGAAYTTVATEIIVFFLSFYLLKKTNIPFPSSFGILIKTITASTIMGICLYTASSFNLFVNLGIAGITFAGILFILDPKIIQKTVSNLSLTKS